MQGELEKDGESIIILGSILHLNAGIFQTADQTNTWKHLHVCFQLTKYWLQELLKAYWYQTLFQKTLHSNI